VRIELTNYDPGVAPLFIGLSVTPYVYIHETPTGPNAGKMLQASVSATGPVSAPAPQ
jgi:membrane fusion protein (multidrug efflux system)